MTDFPFTIRRATAEDAPLILNAIIRSTVAHSGLSGVEREFYTQILHLALQSILGRCRALVACNPDRPTQVYAFCLFESPDVLHYIYTKRYFRQLGLATALLKASELLGSPIRLTIPSKQAEHYKDKWMMTINPSQLKGAPI